MIKEGTFTASLVLEHPNKADVTITNAVFEITNGLLGPKQWQVNLKEPNLRLARVFDAIVSNEQDGMIICGRQLNNAPPYLSKGFVIKIDVSGKQLWKKTFIHKNNRNNSLISITATKNGNGYVVSGNTYISGKEGGWAIKINNNGNEIWNKGFAITSTSLEGMQFESIVRNNDSYLISGSEFDGYKRKFGIIYVIDENGTIQKKEYINNALHNMTVYKTIPDANQNFYSLTYAPTKNPVHITLINKGFTGFAWTKEFGAHLTDRAKDFIITKNKEIIIVGLGNSKIGSKGWLLKTDDKGNKIWEHFYGNNFEYEFSKVISGQNGGFVLAGEKAESGIRKGVLFATDKDGNKMWEKTFNAPNAKRNEFNSLTQLGSSYVGVGFSVDKYNVSTPFIVKHTP